MRGVVALGGGSGFLKPGGCCFSPSAATPESAWAEEAASPPAEGSPPPLPPLLLPSRRLGISTDRRRPLPDEGVGDSGACRSDEERV